MLVISGNNLIDGESNLADVFVDVAIRRSGS